MKLYCIPYAGGSAAVFNAWQQYLSPGIKLRALELKGRGRRFTEPLYQDRVEAVDDILSMVGEEMRQGPFAIFGHSMGAKIAFELCHRLQQDKRPLPTHAFFSGAPTPHHHERKKPYHLMEDQEFNDKLFELGGTPREFFDHPELLEIYLPVLKNDFKLAEIDTPYQKPEKLTINITVMLGKEDEITLEGDNLWDHHTNGTCQMLFFEGGHFFLNDHTQLVVKHINELALHK